MSKAERGGNRYRGSDMRRKKKETKQQWESRRVRQDRESLK